MPQIVPSAGFTPPCDYNFADSFDLSLLPEENSSMPSINTNLPHTPSPMQYTTKSKIEPIWHADSPKTPDGIDLGPDFQKLLEPERKLQPSSPTGCIYLEVPSFCSPSSAFSSPRMLSPTAYPSPNSDIYPNSPSEQSFYPNSPNHLYSQAQNNQYVKKENPPFSPMSDGLLQLQPPPHISITTPDVVDLLGTAIIKQEVTPDFSYQIKEFLESAYKQNDAQIVPQKPKTQDHQLLREVLRDTSYQKKYNLKPMDLPIMESEIKMEDDGSDGLVGGSCQNNISTEIDPVLNLAIEQMKKEVCNACSTLGISPGKRLGGRKSKKSQL